MHFFKNRTVRQTYFMKSIQYKKLLGLLLLALVSLSYSLSHGSIDLSYSELFTTLLGEGTPAMSQIVFDIRLPRTVSAFVTGGMLAMSGVLMQVLLRNPLADPYILGVSGGAALMTLTLMLFGMTGLWLTAGAWIGSLAAMFSVFFLAKQYALFQAERVLITGIALASAFSAVISFILLMSPDQTLHGMLFWLLGDLADAHFPLAESVILCIACLWSFRLATPLNILLRGEPIARSLGINTSRLQRSLYFLCALQTAAAVALAGCIGFVGLMVPHALRYILGFDHRQLLPGSVLLGGSLLTIADTLSRTLFAPQQLPVGMLMAFLGVPVMLFLLHKRVA